MRKRPSCHELHMSSQGPPFAVLRGQGGWTEELVWLTQEGESCDTKPWFSVTCGVVCCPSTCALSVHTNPFTAGGLSHVTLQQLQVTAIWDLTSGEVVTRRGEGICPSSASSCAWHWIWIMVLQGRGNFLLTLVEYRLDEGMKAIFFF